MPSSGVYIQNKFKNLLKKDLKSQEKLNLNAIGIFINKQANKLTVGNLHVFL